MKLIMNYGLRNDFKITNLHRMAVMLDSTRKGLEFMRKEEHRKLFRAVYYDKAKTVSITVKADVIPPLRKFLKISGSTF